MGTTDLANMSVIRRSAWRARYGLLIVAVVATVAATLLASTDRAALRTQAVAGQEGEAPPAPVDGHGDTGSAGEGRETVVVVELPSALPGEPPVDIEVVVASPDTAPVPRGELRAGTAGDVSVGQVPVEGRELLAGSTIELQGRVVRAGDSGFWFLYPDRHVTIGDVFVAWGDLQPGDRPRGGDTVVVAGVWRTAGDSDGHLRRAGVEPGTAYVHAVGWSK